MTTMVLVFAMIPLALKLGSGAESRSPMAIVVLGGMITSTMLTLVFVPVMYSYLDDFGHWLQKLGLTTMRWSIGPTPAAALARVSLEESPEMTGVGSDGASGNGQYALPGEAAQPSHGADS